jgi:hypothetical protein
MADLADSTDEKSAYILEADVQAVRNRAAAIPRGEPGECDKCGEESPRLVGGHCAPCRDKYKLP